MVDTSTYEDNLRHVARPSNPAERLDTKRVSLNDFEALCLREALRAVTHSLGSYDDEVEAVAQAYVEYIEQVVYEETKHNVQLFDHTGMGEKAVEAAIEVGLSNAPPESTEYATLEAIQGSLIEFET